MNNAAPQIPPYDLGTSDTIPNLIQLDSTESSLKPQSWELYVERIAPELARQTGETVEEARYQLRTLFQPLPPQTLNTATMLKAMDWDDDGENSTAQPQVTTSGVVSRNRDQDIPVEWDLSEWSSNEDTLSIPDIASFRNAG